ncbi:MAG: PorV/PorQ family protein [bacterium]|nr:PorV/PorQ family protein [bacterium]
MKRVTLTAAALAMVAMPWQQAHAVSEAAVIWLLISPGSRPAGMGEAFVALADDASATWWNPAGLAFSQGRDVRIMHSDWLPAFNLDDIFFDFAAFSWRAESLGGTMGVSIIYLNEGDQTHTGENGEVLGVITSKEYALGVSYGTNLNPELGLGLTGKLIVSDLASGVKVGQQEAGMGISFAVDLGMLWQTRLPYADRPLNLGFNLANIGPEISYADEAQADPLPTNLKLGAALNAYNDQHNEVNLVFDINKQLVHKALSNLTRKQLDGEDAYWNNQGQLTTEAFDNQGNPNSPAFDAEYETDPVFKAMFTSWFPRGVKNELQNYIYNVGAEYWYRGEAGGLGKTAFGLRSGYLNDMAGHIKSYTLGMSLLVNMVSLDFSYELSADKDNPSPRDKTIRYSLGFTF